MPNSASSTLGHVDVQPIVNEMFSIFSDKSAMDTQYVNQQLELGLTSLDDQGKSLVVQEARRQQSQQRAFRNHLVSATAKNLRFNYAEPFKNYAARGEWGNALRTYGDFVSQFGMEEVAGDLSTMRNMTGDTSDIEQAAVAKMKALGFLEGNLPAINQFHDASTKMLTDKFIPGNQIWRDREFAQDDQRMFSVMDVYHSAMNGHDEESEAARAWLVNTVPESRKEDVAGMLRSEVVNDPLFFEGKQRVFRVERNAQGQVTTASPDYIDYINTNNHMAGMVADGQAKDRNSAMSILEGEQAGFERYRVNNPDASFDDYRELRRGNQMQQLASLSFAQWAQLNDDATPVQQQNALLRSNMYSEAFFGNITWEEAHKRMASFTEHAGLSDEEKTERTQLMAELAEMEAVIGVGDQASMQSFIDENSEKTWGTFTQQSVSVAIQDRLNSLNEELMAADSADFDTHAALNEQIASLKVWHGWITPASYKKEARNSWSFVEGTERGGPMVVPPSSRVSLPGRNMFGRLASMGLNKPHIFRGERPIHLSPAGQQGHDIIDAISVIEDPNTAKTDKTAAHARLMSLLTAVGIEGTTVNSEEAFQKLEEMGNRYNAIQERLSEFEQIKMSALQAQLNPPEQRVSRVVQDVSPAVVALRTLEAEARVEAAGLRAGGGAGGTRSFAAQQTQVQSDEDKVALAMEQNPNMTQAQVEEELRSRGHIQ